MTWIWWAPLVAVALHIVEEFVYPGGFADWDRRYRPAIRASITLRLHVILNAALLLVCAQVGFLGSTRDVDGHAVAVAGWLTIAALLFANAVFHIVGTVRTRTRSPGVITGVVLYMPLAAAGYWYFVRSGQASLGIAVGAALLGGSYHFWAAMAHEARARHRAA